MGLCIQIEAKPCGLPGRLPRTNRGQFWKHDVTLESLGDRRAHLRPPNPSAHARTPHGDVGNMEWTISHACVLCVKCGIRAQQYLRDVINYLLSRWFQDSKTKTSHGSFQSCGGTQIPKKSHPS